jgi:hypothetical protein
MEESKERAVHFWVTKYALTTGIYEADGIYFEDSNTNMVRVHGTFDDYLHGSDWHISKQSAIAQAEKMRQAKIKSVKKQLAKLESMKFE